MSLRHASRVVVQGGARVAGGAKPIKDTASAAGNGNYPKKIRCLSSASDAAAAKAAREAELRRKEEALRMVMYLSCWGSN